MNDFSARKLGEVLAFAETFNDTLERGAEAFSSESLDTKQFSELSHNHTQAIKAAADAAGKLDVTLAKAEATNKKLRVMRDTYIGDSWDDITELYEWMGFFCGAAIVHWELIEGVAEGSDNDGLGKIAIDAKGFYESFFERSRKHLHALGSRRQAE
ncbi:MAG TPA: hypothetical protein VNA68_03045 [Candidatus Dormibacteraeota bacterium]|nr:hypothetical protein [Candidatus Dormibacteraeota bacterium]